jgi:hypothetical protein
MDRHANLPFALFELRITHQHSTAGALLLSTPLG